MKQVEERYISLLTDFGFKRIFGTAINKDLLICFLNSLFNGKQVVKDVSYLNPEHVGDVYTDRKAIFDEIMQILVCAVTYIFLLLAGSMVSCSKYCYIGNIWSNFTVFYKTDYEAFLSDNNRFIDQQVFKYYSPYQSLFHSILLLVLCLTLMGTIILFFSIWNKKLIGIILNILLILFVLIFNEHHMGVMWLSPFCHAVLALHNKYVYKQFSVPLLFSYLYLIAAEALLISLSLRQLKNKMFY